MEKLKKLLNGSFSDQELVITVTYRQSAEAEAKADCS